MSRAIRKDDSMADGYLNFDTKINEKGFNEGISKLGSLGKTGLKIASGAITALGTAAGAGVTAAVKVGMAFESEMSKVSAISGATGDDLQALTDKAKRWAQRQSSQPQSQLRLWNIWLWLVGKPEICSTALKAL